MWGGQYPKYNIGGEGQFTIYEYCWFVCRRVSTNKLTVNGYWHIHRTIGEDGTLWQPSVDILNSVIINCSFSDHRVVVLLSICLISTTQNQTWNLSKNLHDPIFGRKNFTH